MAKKSAINNNIKRLNKINKYDLKRKSLKEIISNKDISIEERFKATIKLSELPRNSSKTRYRLRCSITGRPRGNYRKFKLSRNMFREMASFGLIPGVVKSSW